MKQNFTQSMSNHSLSGQITKTPGKTMATLVVLSLGLFVVDGCKKRTTAPPGATIITWTTNAQRFRGQIGVPQTVYCPPGGTTGSVWGTDVYTDDSSICNAAVHAGRISRLAGGAVVVFAQPGMPAYVPSSRNGVTSYPYGPYTGSFGFTPAAMGIGTMPTPVAGNAPPGATALSWSDNGQRFRGQIGIPQTVYCPPGGSPGSVYGTDVYTDDSSVCTAAVHAGRITLAMGGTVVVYAQPGMPGYVPSPRNGVNSSQWSSYAGSFAFTPVVMPVVPPVAPPPSAAGGMQPLSWTDNGTRWRGQNGTRQTVLCPPGGRVGSVWGSGPYTDDSSICSAAVHAGRIAAATGGVVTVVVAPGVPAYVGSPRNGVTSNNYGAYTGSFLIQ